MDSLHAHSKRHILFNYIATIAMVMGALTSAYTPNTPFFKSWSQYADQTAIGFWLLGLLLFVLKKPRLTIVSFVCCAFLCIFLKSRTNPSLVAPQKTNEPMYKVAHFNLSARNSTYFDLLRTIKKTKADIVSLQEVTPDWNLILRDSFADEYPHHCEAMGEGFQKIYLYSKYPFLHCDTFYCESSPNIQVSLRTPRGLLNIIDSYIHPPLFTSAYEHLKCQLDSIGRRVRNSSAPSITVGEYNIHASSAEIQDFRTISNLKDSRRGYVPFRNDGSLSFLEVPVDHIFYTPQLVCIDFQTISGPKAERIGVLGTYQFFKDSLMVSRY
jgi:endonuclease/exonuclease/phosphatase (EEP) superfamily protein YafD